jgi:hypothetical protein
MIDKLYSNSKVMVKCFLLLTAGLFMGLSRGDVVEALDTLFFAARAFWTAAIALQIVLALSAAFCMRTYLAFLQAARYTCDCLLCPLFKRGYRC